MKLLHIYQFFFLVFFYIASKGVSGPQHKRVQNLSHSLKTHPLNNNEYPVHNLSV